MLTSVHEWDKNIALFCVIVFFKSETADFDEIPKKISSNHKDKTA